MLSAVTVKQFELCFPSYLAYQEPHFLFQTVTFLTWEGKLDNRFTCTQRQQLLTHQLLNVLLRQVLISAPPLAAGEA